MKETRTKLWLKVVSIMPCQCWSQMPLLPAIFLSLALVCLAYVTLPFLGYPYLPLSLGPLDSLMPWIHPRKTFKLLDLGGKNSPNPDTKVEVWRVLELLIQEVRPRWYRHDLVRHLQYIQPGLHPHKSPTASVVSVDVRSRYEVGTIGKIIVPINK